MDEVANLVERASAYSRASGRSITAVSKGLFQDSRTLPALIAGLKNPNDMPDTSYRRLKNAAATMEALERNLADEIKRGAARAARRAERQAKLALKKRPRSVKKIPRRRSKT